MSLGELVVVELKKEGLELGEEAAKLAVKAVLNSLEKIVAASENKYDDMLIPLIAVMRPQLLALVDEINPADNKKAE